MKVFMTHDSDGRCGGRGGRASYRANALGEIFPRMVLAESPVAVEEVGAVGRATEANPPRTK